jgi:hypothetical protein
MQVKSQSYFTTDGQSVGLGVEPTLGPVTRYYFLPEIYCLVSMGRPLWREDGSAICGVITQWSKSHRTRNHTLLSHLRLPTLEVQVPVFISPRNRVTQLYLRTLVSLYVASYKAQGYGGGILTRLQTANWLHIFASAEQEPERCARKNLHQRRRTS